jgi:hypothetical protein
LLVYIHIVNYFPLCVLNREHWTNPTRYLLCSVTLKSVIIKDDPSKRRINLIVRNSAIISDALGLKFSLSYL